jgi:hypothetical protein
MTFLTMAAAAKALLLLPLLLWVAGASKDNDYYFPGYENPLTQKKMYWKVRSACISP